MWGDRILPSLRIPPFLSPELEDMRQDCNPDVLGTEHGPLEITSQIPRGRLPITSGCTSSHLEGTEHTTLCAVDVARMAEAGLVVRLGSDTHPEHLPTKTSTKIAPWCPADTSHSRLPPLAL